jgi:hypothetical protein
MGICTYCHQEAGWFTDAHDTCIQKANAGIESVKTCMADAVVRGKQYSEVSAMVEKLTADAAIPQVQVRAALKNGWSEGATKRCKAQPISREEFIAISDAYRDAGFQDDEMRMSPGSRARIFSCLIWTVLHDQIDPDQGPIRFNLQASEIPVFGIANVLLSEQRTVSSYFGGYGGVSVRIASGLYYHLGEVRGHKVENTLLQEVDYGDFMITTRAIYFGGREKGINFQLPYSHILRFMPYSDAVGICRDGGREQIFAPQHIADSGWWLFNVLQALAAKNSAAKGHHA